MKRHATHLLLLLVLGVPGVAGAVTITVDVNGAGDFVSIPDGIDVAVRGDTVLVYPGTYSGVANRAIHLNGKAITLLSRDGADATVIGQEYMVFGRGIVFDAGEVRDTIVDGFTVRRTVDEGAGGFLCYYSSPTIRNCRFEDCWAYGEIHGVGDSGAGLVYVGSPLFEDCVFEGNYADGNCGGVSVLEGSSPVFDRCEFNSNSDGWGGIGSLRVSLASFAECNFCVFRGQSSDRVLSAEYASQVVLTNCTIAGNRADFYALMYVDESSYITSMRSIFAFNDCEALLNSGASVTMSHSCLHATGSDSLRMHGRRGTNLILDPLLCDVYADDFTLCSDSPCLPGGNEWHVQIGAFDQGCDDCGSPVETTSWGAIKVMFR
jgi:hypothetical protein